MMQTLFNKTLTKNQKGLAVLEALPVILVMFVLMGATLGTWGIVHTAILNSIAARNYIFYTFNNSSDLSYYGKGFYRKRGYRFSYISSKYQKDRGTKEEQATLRFVDFRNPNSTGHNTSEVPKRRELTKDNWEHTRKNLHNNRRFKGPGADPAWVMVGYGICLNAQCGDTP